MFYPSCKEVEFRGPEKGKPKGNLKGKIKGKIGSENIVFQLVRIDDTKYHVINWLNGAASFTGNFAECELWVSLHLNPPFLRNFKIELLEKYSMWLTKNGYMDTDWKDEEPFAIDEFLAQE